MFDTGAINQSEFDVKFDWGRSAFEFYREASDVFVAVDVFSFSYFVEHAELENVRAFTKLGNLNGIAQPVLLACIRNAEAVAKEALKLGRRITVIAMGDELGLLGFRPNFEDLMGAGAVISHLTRRKSAQAESAEDSFRYNLPELDKMLARCTGGKLLLSHSSDDALKFVAQLNAVGRCPSLHESRVYT